MQHKVGTRVLAEIPTWYKERSVEKRSVPGTILQVLPRTRGYTFRPDGYDKFFYVSEDSVLGEIDAQDEE